MYFFEKLLEKVRSRSCICEFLMSVMITNKHNISARLSDLLVDLRHHRREHVHGEVPQVHRHKHRREVFARNHSQPNDLLLGESSQQKRRLDQSDDQLRQCLERLRSTLSGEKSQLYKNPFQNV